MKKVLMVLTMFLILGCSILKPRSETTETVRIEYREILKDTIIYVSIPKEVLVKETFDTTSFLETSLSKSSVTVSGKKLTHTLENKVDSIKTKIVYKDKFNIRDSISIKKIPIPYPVERKLNWWQNFKIKIGTYLFIGLAIMLLLFFYKLKK